MADNIEGLTLDEYRDVKDGLIRKMVSGGAMLLAPYGQIESADDFKLTHPDGSLREQTGFSSLGRFAKSGAPTFTPDNATEDVESWGEAQASRVDLTTSNLTVEMTMHDTRRETLAVATRQNLDSVRPDSESGELQITDNAQLGLIHYTAIVLGVDGLGDDAFYVARLLPKVIITSGPESWDPSTAVQYPLTVRALVDGDLGFSSRRFYAGPGAKRLMDAMGFAGVPSGGGDTSGE